MHAYRILNDHHLLKHECKTEALGRKEKKKGSYSLHGLLSCTSFKKVTIIRKKRKTFSALLNQKK
jgi:hypothetical protein